MNSMTRVVALASAILTLAPIATLQNASAQDGLILQREEPHDWTLRTTVAVRVHAEIDRKTKMPKPSEFDFQTAAVVFPLIRDSAGHFMAKPATGTLKLDDKKADEQYQTLTDYASGTELGKWTLQDWKGGEVELEVTIPVTSFNTKFDEAAALKLGWPKDAWPPVPASTFKPQLFIDVGTQGSADMAPVQELLKKWMGGKDPKGFPPVTVAKVLAGEVIRHVQTSGNGLRYARTGEVEGLSLQGAWETAKRGRGTEWDMVCLLTAIYRQAGLPARTVIGYDVGDRKAGDKFLGRNSSGTLRAWVEFALFDPAGTSQPIIWVPVDVVRMRKSSTRPPPLDKPWAFFGTHDELSGVIPFAFQFHPPTDVVAHGSAAFWGWMVTPKPPEKAVQAIRFNAISTPKRAEDMQKEQERRKRGR
ncbi:MAG: transglutaminase domain-containing protein [Phycisphaerales bacterium]